MSLTLPRRAAPAVRLLKPPPPRMRLPFRQLFGHYVITDTHAWAAYRIPPKRWTGLAADEQAGSARATADRWSKLQGHWVAERTLPQPFTHAAWARALDERTPTPLPDAHTCAGTQRLAQALIAKGGPLTDADYARGGCGCMTYAAWLQAQQLRVASGAMGDDVVIRLVSLGPLSGGEDFRKQLATGRKGDAVRRILDVEQRVFEVMAGPGFNATRCLPGDVEWLVHRSVAPFAPPPKPNDARWQTGWGREDLHLFTDDVVQWTPPFDRAVEVTVHRDGERITQHVVALTLGPMGGFTYPKQGLETWKAFGKRARHDGRAFPIEWSHTFEVLDPAKLAPRVKRDWNVAKQNLKAYAEVGADAPPQARRLPGQAERIYDAVIDGQPIDAVRVDGPLRAYVAGATAKEAIERARALAEVYRRPAMKMELQHTLAQSALVAELVPGAPLFGGHRKQLDLTTLAYGDPAVSSRVGDRRGPYVGYTASGSPWCHDSFYATENGARKPNVHGIAGTLGSGKSVLALAGLAGYPNVKRGINVTVSDPAGTAGRLCSMPELAPHALCFDVLADGEPGILNPPGLILDPTLDECGGDPERFARRMAVAEADRRDLVVVIARKCLPAYLYNRPASQEVIGLASQRVTWAQTSTLWDLIDVLQAMGDDDSLNVARALTAVSVAGKLSLLFAPRGEATDRYTLRRKTLTVIQTPGLQRAEDGVAREDWTPAEHAAEPLQQLVTFFTKRAAYDKPMSERAVLILDELHELMRTSSGRSLHARITRDSSRWNLATYLLDQDPGGIFVGQSADYMATKTVGRVRSEAAARRGMTTLGLVDDSWVEVLMSLQAGEFVHADLDGNIERARHDVDYYPGLKPYVFTDPKPAGSAGWDAPEVLG